jgi:hypothetical protein
MRRILRLRCFYMTPGSLVNNYHSFGWTGSLRLKFARVPKDGGSTLVRVYQATSCHTSRSHNSSLLNFKTLDVHLPRLRFNDCDLLNFVQFMIHCIMIHVLYRLLNGHDFAGWHSASIIKSNMTLKMRTVHFFSTLISTYNTAVASSGRFQCEFFICVNLSFYVRKCYVVYISTVFVKTCFHRLHSPVRWVGESTLNYRFLCYD